MKQTIALTFIVVPNKTAFYNLIIQLGPLVLRHKHMPNNQKHASEQLKVSCYASFKRSDSLKRLHKTPVQNMSDTHDKF